MKRFKYLTLAALVAFAACDEADEIITPPVVTGSISGVVSIEGAGASGVTVTLSSGVTATTDGSGAYAFSGVAAGAYTVSISGFASDAAFSSTAKAATISTAGQVATVSFDGSYVRTSAIFGSVAAGGAGLAGVSVGIGSASTTTDANGQFSFTGLRAGSYTVTISGFDAGMYSFGSTTMAVTLGVGESKPATFTGALMTNAMIKGSVFIDENDKDNTYSAGLEAKLAVAGIPVGLETIPGDTTWTVTDAAGDYMFADLAAGSYKVIFGNPAGTYATLPAMLGWGATPVVGQAVTSGASATVNYPFDILTQAIKVHGYLGVDAVDPGQTPIKGWTVNLYDTQLNAAAGATCGATGRLGTVATDSNGESVYRFLRTADVSPNSATTDLVVFARACGPGTLGAPTATHTISGEQIIEIKYNATDSVSMAPDTLDALYNALVVKFHSAEIDADTLAGWIVQARANKDSTAATAPGSSRTTTASGDAIWDITTTMLTNWGTTDGVFPDTLWFRLRDTQAGAGGHVWTQTPSASDGTANGRFLRFIWNGTTALNDTVMVGTEMVKYMDPDLQFRVHHERDDSTDVATYSAGDNLGRVDAISLQLYKGSTSVAGPTAAALGTGLVTFAGVAMADSVYTVRARSANGSVEILNDTLLTVTADGSDQSQLDATLKGSAGSSSFATKFDNNTVSGAVLARDGVSGVKDIIVTLMPTSDNIQGTAMMLDTTSAAGAYAFTGVREGPYTVSVADIAGSWEFFDTLTTVAHPVSGSISGAVNNTDSRLGSRDVQAYNGTFAANFQPHIMDTKIQGVVVNDRDKDFNTLDPDEALSGVTIELYDDADGDGAIDAGEAMLSSALTDANGAYEFTGLKEDFYIVSAISPSTATILRELSATGAVTAHIGVQTTSTDGTVAAATYKQDVTKNVGNMDPPAQGDEFPRWNYLTGKAARDGGNLLIAGQSPNDTNATLTTKPAHFVHLFNTGTVVGFVKAGAVGVAGVRATITRCQTAATAPSPPTAGACTAKHGTPSPHIQNLDTDSTGKFTFTGLLEGLYQVDIAPATAGYTNIVTPGAGSYLATLQGNNDVETTPDFTIS